MANKTIYVAEKDEPLYEEAKHIAGEALSSVVARALGEYIVRHKEKEKGMKEVSVSIGTKGSEREVRFVGTLLGDWKGFSNDKQWFMRAAIYRTQKGNWAIHLETVCKASLLTDKESWKRAGDYLIDPRRSELITGKAITDVKKQLPVSLATKIAEFSDRDEKPVEYLDI